MKLTEGKDNDEIWRSLCPRDNGLKGKCAGNAMVGRWRELNMIWAYSALAEP